MNPAAKLILRTTHWLQPNGLYIHFPLTLCCQIFRDWRLSWIRVRANNGSALVGTSEESLLELGACRIKSSGDATFPFGSIPIFQSLGSLNSFRQPLFSVLNVRT